MIRNIMRDTFFLSQKSEPATQDDLQIAQDLMETLLAHEQECVGMAANMIGERKRIIAVNTGFIKLLMLNPVIVKKSVPFNTEEGCMSLEGVRQTKRFQNIEVEYQDLNMKKQRIKLSGWNAQVVQHECDHLEGIII